MLRATRATTSGLECWYRGYVVEYVVLEKGRGYLCKSCWHSEATPRFGEVEKFALGNYAQGLHGAGKYD